MPKKPEASEVFRETFVIQVPRRARLLLRKLGTRFYEYSIDWPDDDEQPWNRQLLKAVLLDLDWLERHLNETYDPAETARGWREERLAEAAEECVLKLREICDSLRRAINGVRSTPP